MTGITVSIVCFGSGKYLRRCLEALAAQTKLPDTVMLVDNAPEDGSVAALKSFFATLPFPVEILLPGSNVGYAGGHNRAIGKSVSPYILCLNADVWLDARYCEEIVSVMERDTTIGAASGIILKWDFDRDIRSSVIDTAGLTIFKSHRVVERRGGEPVGVAQNPEKVFGVSGAAMVLRKKAMESIYFRGNYFDERFIAYKEDVDLSFRLRMAGWEIVTIPRARAWHDRSITGSGERDTTTEVIMRHTKKNPAIRFLSYRNHMLWVMKSEPFMNLFLYSPWIGWYELRKFVFMLFREPKNLRAIYDGIRMAPLTFAWRRDILKRRKIQARDMRQWFQ